ncbi:hypothetical protein SCLCIDRAFT_137490 [Scleroderma citrinum Foug A]|uniref:Uncharacterized protein n=1 Tax=Scleroderma citrinum Foug A TaxID=1036808 RepID=A0A0C2YWZ8_9AGAM|nr:hypothetical protein SCLCIDRAFT_137490 [Scleroderma citrinum Foug A]
MYALLNANICRLRTDLDEETSARCFYYQQVQPLPGAPALCTFQDWLSFGAKFAHIAAGGTVYCLLILCGLHLRSAVGKVHGRVPYDVARILRRPHLADSGMLVSSSFTT